MLASEQTDVAVTVYNCILEMLGSSLIQYTGYLEVYRGFTQPLQANTGIEPLLGQGRFLLNPF
jgi:hypothetical protein